MTKNRTIFKKYLYVMTLIIISSFLILGIMMVVFMSNYWKNEKHDLLEENAKGISNLVCKNTIISSNGFYTINSNLMQGFINTFSHNINADIFITDTKGKTLICSENANKNLFYKNIPDDVIAIAMEGAYEGTTDLNEIYEHKCYVVSVPIIVNTLTEQKTIGLVFTVADTKYIHEFQIDIIKIILITYTISLFISFIIIWLLSYAIVKPLRQMSIAAKQFGKGNFSKRVLVTSDDELGQLAKSFNNMADSLSISEGKKRAFIANVSHELKTPMTTISGFIDGILDGTIEKEKQNHYLKIVSDEIKRLSRLVKTMLNLSRIDNENIVINNQEFDIIKLLINITITFEPLINEKNIEIIGLNNNHTMLINGDLDMIYQAVYNLIENAVKFTNNNGYINIEVFESHNNCNIKIKNSGNGIPNDEMEFIFDKFYKTDKSRSQDKNGLGLGLYIAKKIINLHGGNISAESIQGEFCIFSITIPKNKN